jgi:hypothetical protein
MQFQQEGQQHQFQGITARSPEIISSHRMENILIKGHSIIISQLHVIHMVETPSVHPDLQYILSQNKVLFQNPQGLPYFHGVHDHSIPLILRSIPPIFHPYHHTFAQKNEIENIVQELIEFGLIHPVPIPILLQQSWYSIKKVLGTCAMIFEISINSPSNKNFPFLSLMTFSMN